MATALFICYEYRERLHEREDPLHGHVVQEGVSIPETVKPVPQPLPAYAVPAAAAAPQLGRTSAAGTGQPGGPVTRCDCGRCTAAPGETPWSLWLWTKAAGSAGGGCYRGRAAGHGLQ